MEYEKEIGKYLYRVTHWSEHPRQLKEWAVIKAPYDEGDWKEVYLCDDESDAINYINNEER